MADNPHKAHRSRMKAQYLQNGISPYMDHQIMEMLLFFSIPQGDTNPLAHRLLDRFDNVYGVLKATPEQLSEVQGVGEHTATFLSLCGSLILKCCRNDRPVSLQLTSPKEYGEFFVRRFRGYSDEAVMFALLNNRDELLDCIVVNESGVDDMEESARTLLRKMLVANATEVVIAHNHPTGTADPSNDDFHTTVKLVPTFLNVGIRLVDHIVVAGNRYVSMRENPEYGYIFPWF